MKGEWVMYIPERLMREIERMGLDIVGLIIAKVGGIDPKVAVEIRMEIAERFLNETKDYVEKGDAVQASGKLYRVIEECIKALAQHHNTPEY